MARISQAVLFSGDINITMGMGDLLAERVGCLADVLMGSGPFQHTPVDF